ncbi:uncharacterized protein LOC127137395 [Lathyrus oleraceus]|uniref:uncharacterized protein LOC127137395 n=1 Tax=Pisum sativum TaxID=3888 RepID=UPI0021D00ADA|nr:uncharacterized protein LOC127137395 [Pisum sativum]
MEDVQKPRHIYHVGYKFPEVYQDGLLGLVKRFPTNNSDAFRRDYGRILVYVESPLSYFQRDVIHILLQLYDRPLRCFVFLDFLLAPTLEEYSDLLDIPMLHQVPFHAGMKEPEVAHIAATLFSQGSVMKSNIRHKGGVNGYHLGFLVQKANVKADKKDWKAFNAILTCCIYGIILFPNERKFVDMNAISIFIQKNPVPTLLGYMYHFMHSRNDKGKGGVVFCCASLLHRWFSSHLPSQGAFVDTQHTMRWSNHLMGLTSKDLNWYKPGLGRLENKDIIVKCGGFPNVPLLGIRGGVNYNHTFSRRKLGYALRVPMTDREVMESLSYNVPDSTGMMEKATKAWENVHLEGSTYFGQRDSGIYSPYVQWLVERNKSPRWTFPLEDPLYDQSPNQPDVVPRGSYD